MSSVDWEQGRAPQGHPLTLRWGQQWNPLPVRTVRTYAAPRAADRTTATPLGLPTGPTDQPFDFVGRIRRLCADVCRRCPALGHIDVARLLFAVTQAHNGRRHGLQARVTPLRFRGGQLIRRRRGVRYQVQRYFVGSREMLYLVAFCLPRFLDQPFDDKFVTLFHELFHIAPAFDGDLRRHEGRYAIHSHSQRDYDKQMAVLARDYLAQGPDMALYSFLRYDFAQLERRHGSVVGVVVPRPKLIPLPG